MEPRPRRRARTASRRSAASMARATRRPCGSASATASASTTAVTGGDAARDRRSSMLVACCEAGPRCTRERRPAARDRRRAIARAHRACGPTTGRVARRRPSRTHQPKPPAWLSVRRDVAWRYVPPPFLHLKKEKHDHTHHEEQAAPGARPRSVGARIPHTAPPMKDTPSTRILSRRSCGSENATAVCGPVKLI